MQPYTSTPATCDAPVANITRATPFASTALWITDATNAAALHPRVHTPSRQLPA